MEIETLLSLSKDSVEQDDVPKGKTIRRLLSTSSIYPNTKTDFWVYVPVQYSPHTPACVMVFQDGELYLSPQGQVRATVVLDNLIHTKQIPVIIGLFINPATKHKKGDMRSKQYVPIDETYAKFVEEEILTLISQDYNLMNDPACRVLVGWSDGGLASFNAAWRCPGVFAKVLSHNGSFVNINGGARYPDLIRATRGNPKPIRIFLQAGTNDLNILHGNWTLANITMESALMFARYDYKFSIGHGGHNLRHAGSSFPSSLKWIWRDHAPISKDSKKIAFLLGNWRVSTNIDGHEIMSTLSISMVNGSLTGSLRYESKENIKVHNISFDSEVLIIEHDLPEPHFNWLKEKDPKTPTTMSMWVKVGENQFHGALSAGLSSEFDFKVTGILCDKKTN